MDVVLTAPGQELRLVGRLDGRSGADVRAALHAAVDSGAGDLVVHVDALEIWDVTGLGVLAGAHRRAERAGRRLLLVGVTPRLERLLRVARMRGVLHWRAAEDAHARTG